jgi:DsbC/DsbD-like thiol-disulfide interchange protein
MSCLLLAPLSAQQIDFNALRKVVRLNAPEKITASRNQAVTVNVTASLKPGYHVSSNVAPTYPLKVTLAENPAAQLQGVAFPAAKSHQLGAETLSVFDGEFPLKLTLKVGPNAPIGRTVLITKVRYQACDDRVCLRPDTIELKLPLDVQN